MSEDNLYRVPLNHEELTVLLEVLRSWQMRALFGPRKNQVLVRIVDRYLEAFDQTRELRKRDTP